ncbi:MAG TPA: thermonuclease family protein [Dehalococcoidia bacterium]|jgi:micrococcal nuclease
MRRLAWPILPVAALLFAACTSTAAPGVPSPPASINLTATATTPPVVPLETTLPAGLTEARVTRVVDGDTIHVDIAGQDFPVRYIGMNTPETVDPVKPIECYGPEASARNKQLVTGQTVELEKDISETDQYGRLLRFVWLPDTSHPGQGEMVDALLVQEGYARLDTFPPDVRYKDLFAQLQQQAQAARSGLWGDVCTSATPIPATQTAPTSSGDEVCDYSGTQQPVIKGNISSSAERIYHVPGQQFYNQTQIDEASGERWFCTEQEAMDAGWRKSKS